MQDVLMEIYKHADNVTASKIRLVNRKMSKLKINSTRYFTNGYTVYKVGKHRHREDGPALIRGNTCMWYYAGKLHRSDGPAVETPHKKLWYRHGKLHREDGSPAVIYKHLRVWCINGKRHREDGPAVIFETGSYIYVNPIDTLKYNSGKNIWYKNGVIYRDGGLPSVQYFDKSGLLLGSVWYSKGTITREYHPAIIFDDTRIHIIDGKRHDDVYFYSTAVHLRGIRRMRLSEVLRRNSIRKSYRGHYCIVPHNISKEAYQNWNIDGKCIRGSNIEYIPQILHTV